ncbi:MAG: type II toxin-antitoxin system RelE/ParE family toxin [Acidobacteria bacterium]|nr:type II toxin-antitoxin system RelE/ParE family toxin [Acidobacteriota bacterium]
MVRLQEYLDLQGRNEYRRWFNELDVAAATKVTVALERLATGNISAVKSVGDGVSECRIDFGPGYRVYFGKDGEQLVILLGGGTKKRQNRDIEDAKVAWHEYKQRKKDALKQAESKGSAKAISRNKTKKKRQRED